MADSRETPRSTFNELIVWCIAAPILSVWALVSVFPLFGLVEVWGDVVQVLVELAFLSTGAVGLAAAAVGYRWMRANGSEVSLASSATRTMRAAVLSAWAVVWMALYAL